MFQPTAHRTSGVLVQNPDRPSGSPKTISHFVPAQFVAAQYVDEQGMPHATILMKIGNMWYMPPNAEQWSGALKPLAGWLSKLCEEQLQAQTAAKQSVPTEDAVNLFESQPQGIAAT